MINFYRKYIVFFENNDNISLFFSTPRFSKKFSSDKVISVLTISAILQETMCINFYCMGLVAEVAL